MNTLAFLFPLLHTLKGYRREDLRADAVAGLTTAVMLVPQGMAYAMLAGLPPILGVYAALVPPVSYALFGTSRQLSVGPVATDSLLVFAGVGALYAAGTDAYLGAVLVLSLLVGVIQVLLGLMRMGFLINFLSRPVIHGFTSAAALIIALSQVPHFLGVEVKSSLEIATLLPALLDALPKANPKALALGISALILLLLLKRFAKKVPGALVAVVVGTLAVTFFGMSEQVALVGTVPRGLPPFVLPPVSFELLRALLPTALTIAFVGFMESISVAQVYAKKNQYRLDADREWIALGLANTTASLFSGYPVAGGFSRTAVHAEAGARTPVAALITSLVVGVVLILLTPLFYFLPKAALSAIIVAAVVGLFNVSEVRHLHQVKKADLAFHLITFSSTLVFGILPGIGVGVAASLGWFIFLSTRPHVAVLGRVPGTKLFRNVARNPSLITYQGVIALRMDAEFYFGNVRYLRSTLEQWEDRIKEPLRAVILDFSAVNGLDSSALEALREMFLEHSARGVQFLLAGVKGPVSDVLASSGFAEQLGQAARCPTVYDAIVSIDAEPRQSLTSVANTPLAEGLKASGSSARL